MSSHLRPSSNTRIKPVYQTVPKGGNNDVEGFLAELRLTVEPTGLYDCLVQEVARRERDRV